MPASFGANNFPQPTLALYISAISLDIIEPHPLSIDTGALRPRLLLNYFPCNGALKIILWIKIPSTSFI